MKYPFDYITNIHYVNFGSDLIAAPVMYITKMNYPIYKTNSECKMSLEFVSLELTLLYHVSMQTKPDKQWK